jgi:hypothetical protein
LFVWGHSLEKDRNMTGPSLAGIWNRKAGTLASFSRYSDAMKHSGLTWDEQSLDGYLKKTVRVHARQSHDVSRYTRREGAFERYRILEICSRNTER